MLYGKRRISGSRPVRTAGRQRSPPWRNNSLSHGSTVVTRNGAFEVLKVYSAPTLPDAHLVRGLLAQAGIDARVFNENAQSVMGEIPFHHAWPEVWIMDEREATQARELIHQIERPQAHYGSAFCPHCHEENPGNFHTCWNCAREF